jgi:hypothetical protein
MLVFPQNPYVKILTPVVTVLEDGTCGRQLVCEGEALRSGESTLIKRPQRSLFSVGRCNEESGIL